MNPSSSCSTVTSAGYDPNDAGDRTSVWSGQLGCLVRGQGRAHVRGEDPTDLVRVHEPRALGRLDVDAVEHVDRLIDEHGRDGAELATVARLHRRSWLQ